MGWDYNSHIVCMCIIMRWSRNRSAGWQRDFRPPHYYAHTNYVTIILPFQSCLLSFLHHPYYVAILNLQDFSFTCIQSTTVLCDRDGQGPPHHRCIGQNSSFSSSPPPPPYSDSTPIAQKGKTTLFTSKQQQMPQAIHYKGRYVAV